MYTANPYDPHEILANRYANLVTGHYRMKGDYRIQRPAGTNDWLIILTLSGEGLIRQQDAVSRVGAGHLVAFPPGTPHDYGTDPETGTWELLWVHLHPPPDWLRLLDWPRINGGILCKILPSDDVGRKITALFRDMYDASTDARPMRDWFAMNLLESMLLHVHEIGAPQSVPLDPKLEKVISYIRRNLAEDLSLDRLIEESHLSVTQLSALFRQHLQTSPRKYIEACRIELAKRLLRFPTRSIKETAYEVGFADPLYFSKRFHFHTGQSPEAYRRACQTKDQTDC